MGAGSLALLPARGAQPERQSRYKPISVFRFLCGYYTNRNPLRSPLSAFYSEGWGLGQADGLIDGLNTEVSPRLTLIRRPGFLIYSLQLIPGSVTGFYSFRQVANIQNPIDLIVDTSTAVAKVTPTTVTTIYTKAAGAGPAKFLGIGNFLYIGDGISNTAWQDPAVFAPAANPRNWGISIGLFSGPTGPNNPTVGSDVVVSGASAWSNPGNITSNANATVTVGTGSSTSAGPTQAGTGSSSGSPAWSNPGNITSGGSSSAQVVLSANGTSGTLSGSNYGFAIPASATVTGVVVKLYEQQLSGTSALYALNIALTGVGPCISKADPFGTPWPNSQTQRAYGTSSDTWGATLSSNVINTTAFGVQFQVTATGGPGNGATAACYGASITVYYTASTTVRSDLLQGTGYGFNPGIGSMIQGLQVEIQGLRSGTSTSSSLSVQLMKNGQPVGAPVNGVVIGTSQGNTFIGGATNLWGTTWNAIDLGSGFGVSIQATNPQANTTETYTINGLLVTAWIVGGPAASQVSSGSFTATKGYSYVAAYGNSNAGSVSSATPNGAGTGAFSNINHLAIPVVASTDPQVNQIWLFRTNDGGSLYFNLPTSPYPNTTATIQDSSPDIDLNILQPAPINSVNNPPPTGAQDPVYFQGRVWVHVGNTLYASGGPDTLLGNGAEAFPPLNYFIFPSPIVRKLPTSAGLALFFTDGVGMLILPPGLPAAIGNYIPKLLLDGIGLGNWNGVDSQGTKVYMFTTENQFIAMDLASAVLDQTPVQITELGFSIQDKLVQISPSAVSVADHRALNDRGLFVADAINNNWYKCVPMQPPDYTITGPIWSPPGALPPGIPISLFASVEISPGKKALLCGQNLPAGSSSGQTALLYRDSSFGTFEDAGGPYEAYMTIGSIVLAHPGQLAELGFITSEFIKTGTLPSISVLMNEISGTFLTLPNGVSDPPFLYGVSGSPASLYSTRYYFRQGNAPQVLARHMQQRIDFGNDAVMNEMISNTIWGTIIEEVAP